MLVLQQINNDFYNDEFDCIMQDIKGLQIISNTYNNHYIIGDKNMIDTGVLEDIYLNIFSNAYADYEIFKDFTILKDAQKEIKEDFDIFISITNLYKTYFYDYNIDNAEWCLNTYKKLFNKNYKSYRSVGYSQGDIVNILYDADIYDLDYVKYIDDLIWGKYDTFNLIEDGEVIEIIDISHDYTFDKNKLLDYVKNKLHLLVDEIQIIEGYTTIPTYESIEV